ncbi:sulfatase-like hydrolase/transferase [Halorubrum ruber]|uniref:Sulfatase-like hydrolase/transferase n=1 Tax=Halorubrum ruber TaxID=2982524 RepID=A0A8T8LLE4_9EURY|nr:sulfatase-like hydrolase/transferase [Halorubrum ruber]QUO47725.1 sulfatase-like hydrolase/transferase [Halorubrum ruber]
MAQLPDIDISNVFLYIGDAVRWDTLPESLAECGQLYKTIAAGIHTPTSFSSIVTGLHPPQHGVDQFGDKLDPALPSLFNLSDVEARFTNTINERFNEEPDDMSILDSTLATTTSHSDSLSDIETPFIFVERGPGGHAPYGEYLGNAWEYYRDRKGAPQSRFRQEYEIAVERDIEYFNSRVEQLKARGLLDDTLIIYTSDHGELLGEEGCLGHNSPVHPNLAYVPTVFFHPDLNNKRVTDGVLRHIDLFPTILELLDVNDLHLPGRDITTESIAECGACFYNKSVLPSSQIINGELSFESVWDYNGGYVFPQSGKINRSAILLGKLLRSAKREYMRQHLFDNVPFYLSGPREYGNTEMSIDSCRSYLDRIEKPAHTESDSRNLEQSTEERLRELGYLQ